jgi:hypothetical protein
MNYLGNPLQERQIGNFIPLPGGTLLAKEKTFSHIHQVATFHVPLVISFKSLKTGMLLLHFREPGSTVGPEIAKPFRVSLITWEGLE